MVAVPLAPKVTFKLVIVGHCANAVIEKTLSVNAIIFLKKFVFIVIEFTGNIFIP
jgi:hypothetical protein